MADPATPMPTPAKCRADRPGRPASTTCRRTSAEAQTSTMAEATPPTKRRIRKAARSCDRPMARVLSALTVRAAIIHWRGRRDTWAWLAPRAPSR